MTCISVKKYKLDIEYKNITDLYIDSRNGVQIRN